MTCFLWGNSQTAVRLEPDRRALVSSARPAGASPSTALMWPLAEFISLPISPRIKYLYLAPVVAGFLPQQRSDPRGEGARALPRGAVSCGSAKRGGCSNFQLFQCFLTCAVSELQPAVCLLLLLFVSHTCKNNPLRLFGA